MGLLGGEVGLEKQTKPPKNFFGSVSPLAIVPKFQGVCSAVATEVSLFQAIVTPTFAYLDNGGRDHDSRLDCPRFQQFWKKLGFFILRF